MTTACSNQHQQHCEQEQEHERNRNRFTRREPHQAPVKTVQYCVWGPPAVLERTLIRAHTVTSLSRWKVFKFYFLSLCLCLSFPCFVLFCFVLFSMKASNLYLLFTVNVCDAVDPTCSLCHHLLCNNTWKKFYFLCGHQNKLSAQPVSFYLQLRHHFHPLPREPPCLQTTGQVPPHHPDQTRAWHYLSPGHTVYLRSQETEGMSKGNSTRDAQQLKCGNCAKPFYHFSCNPGCKPFLFRLSGLKEPECSVFAGLLTATVSFAMQYSNIRVRI